MQTVSNRVNNQVQINKPSMTADKSNVKGLCMYRIPYFPQDTSLAKKKKSSEVGKFISL
jgi:hypothetical protein